MASELALDINAQIYLQHHGHQDVGFFPLSPVWQHYHRIRGTGTSTGG